MSRNKPLISTLIALFFLYGLLAAAATWEQFRSRRDALSAEQLAIERQAAAIGNAVDRALLSVDLMLTDAVSAMVDRGTPAAEAAIRRHVPYALPGTQTGIYDGEGRLIAGGRAMMLRPASIAETAYFHRHRYDGIRSATVHLLSPRSALAGLGQARSVVDDRGGFLGVIVAMIDGDVLAGLVSEHLESETRVCAFLTGAESAVRMPGPDCGIGLPELERTRGTTADEAALGGGIGQFGTLTDMTPDRLVSLHGLRSFPLTLHLSKDLEVVLAGWRERATVWAIALAVSGLLLVGFAAWVAVLERARMRLATRFHEEELARRQAQESDKLKSQFISKMSHEFRTPLNAILGFAQVIKDELIGPLQNRKYLEYANDIHISGEHMLSLVNDFLELSKIEAGRMQLKLQYLSVRSEVAAVLRMVAPKADAKGVSIYSESIIGEAHTVADQRALRQMLLNLVGNAVKFTGPGGRVDIELDQSDADCDRLRVRDTGCGVPAGELDRIVRPFEQVNGSSDPSSEGTGLGLPIVKSLAELHGGSFALTSEVGVGTTATVTLPRQAVSPDAPEGPAVARA